jgi:hypothetical protein
MKKNKPKSFSKPNKFMTYNGQKAGNKGGGHPHFVYAEEQGRNFHSFGITTAQFTDEDNGNITENIPLRKNPDPKSARPSFARPIHISDKKRNYTTNDKYMDWKLDPNDLKERIPPKWKK